ncbi:MAG: hypothetical protein CFE21_06925 [Bacteroidetes bacterium B1(2017)]|nr:MAG: hypothetical protein CFE21_06925 [Bacteroidetes bacterium B1(2017)]
MLLKSIKIKNLFVFITVFFLLGSNQLSAQNFPKLGNDSLLDVANWNVEWFGDISNGPTDEATQFANVKAMLEKTDMDVFALEEISNANAYNSLSSALAAKYDTYISAFSQTQKMGIYWKKSMFDVIIDSSFDILNSQASKFGGRSPLRVALKTKGGTKTDTLYFIVLHMKAFADVNSYNNRVDGSNALKTYLESVLRGTKYIVLGDWNDDLDESIYNASVSPYKNFLNANYTFPSKELTDAGKSSYAFSVNMIDHQMISKTLDSFYFKGSAKVLDNAATYCTGFSNNTSDHYPIYSYFDWKKLTTRVIPAGLENSVHSADVNVYPNPAKSSLIIQCDKELTGVQVCNLQGQVCIKQELYLSPTNTLELAIQDLEAGMYYLKIESGNTILTKPFVKQ